MTSSALTSTLDESQKEKKGRKGRNKTRESAYCLCSLLGVTTFRLLMHFELIFVHGVRECSNILLRIAVQFSQHHLSKRLSFLHCLFLPLSSQLN